MRRNGNDKDRGSIASQDPAKKVRRNRVRGSGQADARKGSPVRVPVTPKLRPILEEESRRRSEETAAGMNGTAVVEIVSAAPNRVVLRLPWRRYPGALIQGDDLFGLASKADEACEKLAECLRLAGLTFDKADGIRALFSLRDDLHEIAEHYRGSMPVHDHRHTKALRLIRAREEHI
jgi:hypothetical protein